MKYESDYDYPEEIQDYANRFTTALEDEKFFTEEESIDPKYFYNQVCEFCMPKWLNGESIVLDMEEAKIVFARAKTQTVIESLKKDGIVDTIIDEDGEEVVFLTKAGRNLADKIAEENGISGEEEDNTNEENL